MKYVLISLFLAVGNPAFATDYLIQYPGTYTCATEKRLNAPQPKPGTDCETGSNWAVWQIIGNDDDPHNYIVNADHTLTHAVPAPFVPPKEVTTVNGSAGALSWAMPGQGATKKVVASFSGYTNASTTITFPTPFTVKPSVTSASVSGITGVTITKTNITFAANSVDGTVVLEGI